MKLLTWNISGACNKDEELEALIRETEADVCVLTDVLQLQTLLRLMRESISSVAKLEICR